MSRTAVGGAGRRMETMPFGSLIVGLGLLLVQVGSWPLLFVFSAGLSDDGRLPWFLSALAVLWMLLPAGAVYGLYLALRREANDFGRAPRALGFIANAVYLLFGIFLWLILLMGVRV